MWRHLYLVLLCSVVCAAWSPLGQPVPAREAAAAEPEAAASPHDPFLDDVAPRSRETPWPTPAAAAVQDPDGTTVPSATPDPSPAARVIGGPQYVEHGLWGRLLPDLLGPVPVGTTPYDGFEYRAGAVVFRPALFRWEAIVLSVGVAYILSTYFGRRSTRSRATSWIASVADLLEAQFSRIDPMRAEAATSYYLWASGRRHVRGGMRVHLQFRPRGDVLLQLYELVRPIVEPTWTGGSVDRIEVELPLLDGGDYIFCVADKAAIASLREQRWDLETFAPVADSSLIPGAYCTMSETSAVPDTLLRSPEVGLAQYLAARPHPLLESLVISDVPDDQPSEEVLVLEGPLAKARKVVMRIRMGSAEETNELLTLALNLVDLLARSKPALPEGAAQRLIKRRVDILAGLRKPLLEEKRQEREKAAAEARRKIEQDRRNALTPDQLKKQEERDRKRALRKQQGRTVKRVG